MVLYNQTAYFGRQHRLPCLQRHNESGGVWPHECNVLAIAAQTVPIRTRRRAVTTGTSHLDSL